MSKKSRMRQSPKAKQPEPVSPAMKMLAEELGVPELGQPVPGSPVVQQVRVFDNEVEQRINTPEKGDIVQVVVKPNEYLARIGIVHEVKKNGTLVCYLPGRGGFPSQFNLASESVIVVGRAKLKYNKEHLPEPSVYSDEAARLDKI